MSSTFDQFTNSAKLSDLCERLRNGAQNSGVLALKTTSDPDAKTTVAIVTSIGGKIGTVATQATIDLSALLAVPLAATPNLGSIPAGYSAGVFLFTDIAGTTTAQISPAIVTPTVATIAAGTAGVIACPAHANTLICYGSIKIVNGSVAAFVVGTTALDKSLVTTTYTNHSTILAGHEI